MAGEYLRKGRSVYIEGRLRTRKWTDKDGIEKYTTEIYGEQMQLLGGREGGGGGGGMGSDGGGDAQENIEVILIPRADLPAFVAAKRAAGIAIDVKMLLLLGDALL